MPDGASTSSPTLSPPAIPTSFNHNNKPPCNGTPPGNGMRRAMTIDETALRRRSTTGIDGVAPPRRSSNFSEYSLSEARDILNPKPEHTQQDSSTLASLSLAFALLPALAGVLFKNGSAVVTDVMLLGLAGVFLHWSVTQPWAWYHSAQEVRVQYEVNSDTAVDDDAETEVSTQSSQHTSPLDDVPEEPSEHDAGSEPEVELHPKSRQKSSRRQATLTELHIYEVTALLSCSLLPLVGAYLLHAIRSQLSRPSEGLVSNYNLTIFLLVSEMRVFSHMIKLVQSRTLHLHRVVQENSFESKVSSNSRQIEELVERLQMLESRLSTEANIVGQAVNNDSARTKQETTIARDMRNAIQPELDALNRAVRRYEKKATILQAQTESRFASVDAKLGDAIALAASAVKQNAPRKSTVARAAGRLISLLLFPLKTIARVLLLPLRALLAMVNKGKQGNTKKTPRGSRVGRGVMQPRYSGDRIPTRVAKR